jgi:Amt family ammonium transporter
MAIYIFGFTYLVFSLVNSASSMRVSKEVELEGLDVPEFGMEAYPEDRVEMIAPGAQVARA